MRRVWLLVVLWLALLCAACKQEAPVVVKEETGWSKQEGALLVLNSCGMGGAADQMSTYLRSRGFSVAKVDNDREWSNYPETVIAIRDTNWPGRSALARALKTNNFIPLLNKNEVFPATIFVGRDYQRIMND
jgi:hypothetical protein